jgi:hypothetical protein
MRALRLYLPIKFHSYGAEKGKPLSNSMSPNKALQPTPKSGAAELSDMRL